MSRNVVRIAPYAAVALAACAWGTWALALRRAESLGAMSAAFESTVVMAVITVVSGIVSLRDRMGVRARVTRTALSIVVGLGVTDAFNVLLFFSAYKITIAVAVLAHYLTPVLVSVAAPIFLRERVTRRTAFAVAASIAGLVSILAGAPLGADIRALWLSAALGAGSAVFYASNVILNKFVVATFSTSEAIFLHGLVATPLLAVFVPPSEWLAVDPGAAGFLALIAIGPGALSGLAFLWGLRRMPAAHASTLTLLEPFVSVLLGAAVFGESIGWRGAVGGGLILGGALAVISQNRADPTSRSPASLDGA